MQSTINREQVLVEEIARAEQRLEDVEKVLASARKDAIHARKELGDIKRQLGYPGRKLRASEATKSLRLLAVELRGLCGAGATLRQIAEEFERRGLKTPAGKAKWFPATVKRLLT